MKEEKMLTSLQYILSICNGYHSIRERCYFYHGMENGMNGWMYGIQAQRLGTGTINPFGTGCGCTSSTIPYM